MTDPHFPSHAAQNDAAQGDTTTPMLVYIGLLGGLLLQILPLVAVIVALINKGSARGWLRSHYTFQIRTFWMLLIYGFGGLVLAMMGFGEAMLVAFNDSDGTLSLTDMLTGLSGLALMFFAIVWLIVRCAKGIGALGRREPIHNPTRWGL